MSTVRLTEAELAVCRACWIEPSVYAARKSQRATVAATAQVPRGTLSAAELEIARVMGRTEAEQLARLGRSPRAHDEESASDDADDDEPEIAIEDRASRTRSPRAFGGPGFCSQRLSLALSARPARCQPQRPCCSLRPCKRRGTLSRGSVA